MGITLKRLAILGSTGSIGQQTLDIVRAFPKRFRVAALAAGNNTDLLTKQIAEFKPEFAYCQDKHLPGTKFLSPEEMAAHPDIDTIVIATSGKSGLTSTLAAVKTGKNVALANKESLVMAGRIITRAAIANDAHILPIDSEHSAIWQCLNGEKKSIARIVLTASGGPFHTYPPSQLAKVTPVQALKHPSWKMGKKITIDSATLMNKGLEVIEAHWLFDIPFENIDILIHPQSIVHSMVEFVDGSIKAQLSYPDMRLPIQYALTYPERVANPQLPKLSLSNLNNLTFEEPDFDTFPCLKLALDAGKKGGTYPAVLCGADEVAVELFLSGRIGFTDIARLVEKVLGEHKPVKDPTFEEIIAADAWAREKFNQLTIGEIPC